MEEQIYRYRKLIELLEEEYQIIGEVLEGELLEQYRSILLEETGKIKNNSRLFYEKI